MGLCGAADRFYFLFGEQPLAAAGRDPRHGTLALTLSRSRAQFAVATCLPLCSWRSLFARLPARVLYSGRLALRWRRGH